MFDNLGDLVNALERIQMQWIGKLPVMNDKGEICTSIKLNKESQVIMTFEKPEGVK